MVDSISTNYQNNFSAAQMQGQLDKVKSLQDNLLTTAKELSETNESEATKAKKDKKLLDASQQFESVFVYQLLQEMDKTVERSEFMHGGSAEEMFRGLFYQEIAKNISTSPTSNFGLGKQIYDQLSKFE